MQVVFVEFASLSLTFLCDADGAAAHPHSQSIHSCIDEVLSLSCSHHYSRQRETQRMLEMHTLQERSHYPDDKLICPSSFLLMI